MFTWSQIVAVIGLMAVSFFAGRRHGRKTQEKLTELYRGMWVQRVSHDPEYK